MTMSSSTWLMSMAVSVSVAAVAGPLRAEETRLEALAQRARTLTEEGRLAEAIPVVEEGLAMAEQRFGPNDPAVASVASELAGLCITQGRYGEAEALYQRALAIWQDAAGPDDPSVAYALNNLGQLTAAQRRYEEAVLLYQRALAIWEHALGSNHPYVGIGLNNLAAAYTEQGRFDDAEYLYQQALAIFVGALGADQPVIATTLDNLKKVAEARRAKAAELEALAASLPAPLDLKDVTAGSARNEYAETEELYRWKLKALEETVGPSHPNTAGVLNDLAFLCTLQGRTHEAQTLYQRVVEILEQAFGLQDPRLIAPLTHLAVLSMAQSRPEQAEPLYARVVAIFKKTVAPSNAEFAKAFEQYAQCLEQGGKSQQADAVRAELKGILDRENGESD